MRFWVRMSVRLTLLSMKFYIKKSRTWFQFVSDPWNSKFKIFFMQFLLLKISQFVWEPWKKSHYFALKIFMVLKQKSKFLYWVKLKFHGSERNWKTPLLSRALASLLVTFMHICDFMWQLYLSLLCTCVILCCNSAP